MPEGVLGERDAAVLFLGMQERGAEGDGEGVLPCGAEEEPGKDEVLGMREGV